jgi:2-polyprenyl-3-methyl-5-hydroxy-6-metoxy-1,4-benzoquinol methylase
MTEQVDKEGFETLSTLSAADSFNQWMFDTIRPFIKGNIFEAGSGIGNISGLLLNMGHPVTLSDFSLPYKKLLQERFGGHAQLAGILDMDLEDKLFDEKFAPYFGMYDTVIALNVIEHVKGDGMAVANCKKLLKKGGHFIALVPAYQLLYNRFDKELGHHKRYNKKSMQRLVAPHLSILQCRYFNLAGILGWFVSGTILKNKTIPSSQMDVFNALVPLFKVMDGLVFHQVGLSVWLVATRR